MAYRPSAGRNQRPTSAPKLIDLVPIINLFITIVPFLLLILVISQIALVSLNFTQSTGGGTSTTAGGGSPKTDLPLIEVIITAPEDNGNGVTAGFEIREPSTQPVMIGLENNLYNYASLDSLLRQVKSRYQTLGDINVIPYPYVRYETLMKTIDLCKSNEFLNVHYKAPQTLFYLRGK
jgi:hypothetical protein